MAFLDLNGLGIYHTNMKDWVVGEINTKQYVHPSTHPASMIVQDATHRMVSDTQITNWNSKLGATDNAVSASKLATSVNINGVAFDGTKSITITAAANGGDAETVGGFTVAKSVPANAVFTDTNTTYSASTGLTLTGTAFSVKYGTAAGTACQGNDSRLSDARPANGGTSAACSGNSATATKLQTARTINGVSFDGSGNITITAAANGGTSASCSGNAATATKLATARTINGVAFDGTENITVSAQLPTNVTIEGTLTVKGSILSNDNVTAYSDRRLKENIQVIKNPLDRISLVHGYVYNFIDDPKVQRTGLIAQELQKVLPQAVKTVNHETHGEVLAINYGETVGLLFEGMRELISENKKLKAEIEELKLKIK